MKTNDNVFVNLKALWHCMHAYRHKQLVLLAGMMLLTSLLEAFSIGSVIPFLGVLVAPERIFVIPMLQPVIKILKLEGPEELLLPLSIAFCLAVLISGSMRLILLWASTRLSFSLGADLSIQIYRRTLYQPYGVHCDRNSSEIINGISVKTNTVIYSIILPTLTFIGSSIMLSIILVALLLVQPIITLAAFGGFGGIYIAIVLLTRRQLSVDSKCIAQESTRAIKALQEGLGGIRDIIIDGSQESYCKIYQKADALFRRSQGNSLFIGASPRYVMESLGMFLIIALAWFLAQQKEGIYGAIPILGALAFGAQRLLPILQQAYGSWTQINSGQASLKDVLELLSQPMPQSTHLLPVAKLPFHKTIQIKQLRFSYGERSPNVLKDINLSISKGDRVGFIGASGSGKSTLLDIVMGLLHPTSGRLEVDGIQITHNNCRAWQMHIAHVPQAIFLADNTIEQNIAFGVPADQIDRSRVELAAKQAQISDAIEGWPKGYQTLVGERGIQLSGGQRQRIGIARALYKESDIIIFDEATSALDNKTEKSVMNVIEGLSKDITLLIIAHRLTTLKSCTQIVDLCDGSIKSISEYDDINGQYT